jgi:hypothetical protein
MSSESGAPELVIQKNCFVINIKYVHGCVRGVYGDSTNWGLMEDELILYVELRGRLSVGLALPLFAPFIMCPFISDTSLLVSALSCVMQPTMLSPFAVVNSVQNYFKQNSVTS